MATPVKETAWLQWMAGLMGAGSRQKQTAVLPAEHFYCLLDELPLHLIPGRTVDRLRGNFCPAKLLVLNPDCFVLPPGEVPAEFGSSDLLAGFSLKFPIAWVREPYTGALHPFWMGPRLASIVTQLKPREPVPADIPDDVKFILASAGILRVADESGPAPATAVFSTQAQSFQSSNYTPVANLIHPFHLAALRRYYRRQIRAGAIYLGDEQSSRRYVAHNEPVARYFHHQLTKAMSAIVGEPVKPSYVYLGSYLPGAELKKHIDREQCEFSLTLCLDFSPEPEAATSWPICVATREGTVTFYQRISDGLVYRGTRVPHFRTMLAPGHTSTSIFFHYVPVDFAGSLD